MCEVVIQYNVEVKDCAAGWGRPRAASGGLRATVPLVMPVEGDLTANSIMVTAKEGLRVQTPGGSWKPAEIHDFQGIGRNGLQWNAAERTSDVTLARTARSTARRARRWPTGLGCRPG